MKLWTSSETHIGLGEDFREIRNEFERAVNSMFEQSNFGDGLVEIAFIPIILPENFEEYKDIKKFKKRAKEVELRLRIPFSEFKQASRRKKISMLFDSLIIGVRDFPSMKIDDVDVAKLISALTLLKQSHESPRQNE